MPDGYLLFSDIPADRIYSGGPSRLMRPTGLTRTTTPDPVGQSSPAGPVDPVRPAGRISPTGPRRPPGTSSCGASPLATRTAGTDGQSRVVACEQGNRRVSRIEADGTRAVLADRYQGKRLNSPNDVVVKSDGSVYFTDPPYGITPGESSSVRAEQEQPCNGLYRIRTDGTVELLVDDFDRPNGLAFSPDESLLYVADSPRRHVRAFAVDAGGGLTDSRIFADMDHPQPAFPTA